MAALHGKHLNFPTLSPGQGQSRSSSPESPPRNTWLPVAMSREAKSRGFSLPVCLYLQHEFLYLISPSSDFVPWHVISRCNVFLQLNHWIINPCLAFSIILTFWLYSEKTDLIDYLLKELLTPAVALWRTSQSPLFLLWFSQKWSAQSWLFFFLCPSYVSRMLLGSAWWLSSCCNHPIKHDILSSSLRSLLVFSRSTQWGKLGWCISDNVTAWSGTLYLKW